MLNLLTPLILLKNGHERIKAQLKKIGKHCYVFVETGRKVDAKAINKIVDDFDKKIYPEVRSMFGEEWNPGIDGDPKITLLLMDIKDTYNPDRGQKGFTAGYFYAGDEYNRSKNPKSNEREMLYLDIYPGVAGDKKFLSVVAHEFQHMVHWNNDPKEYTWVNESLSQLAPFLCGYGHPPQVHAFIRNSDNNLCAWSNDDMLSNYGQVYLWAYYISTHISDSVERRKAFVRRMVAQTSQGLSGLNAAITKQRIKNSAKNIFRNFCVANFLNDGSFSGGDYGYDKFLAKLALNPSIKIANAPFAGRDNVKCWSSKAVLINPQSLRDSNIKVTFDGQRINSSKYCNRFDVAAVMYHSSKKVKPTVEWLNIREFKASQVLTEKLGERDRMMLVVVNSGPDTMKVETAFAKGCPPAQFSFSITPTNQSAPKKRKKVAKKKSTKPRCATTARRSSTSRSRSSVSRARARSVIEELASAPELEEDINLVLGETDDVEKSSKEVSLDFSFQKTVENENLIVDSIIDGIREGNFEVADEFLSYYSNANPNEKSKLASLRNRIRDVLKFEAMQGNEKAKEFVNSGKI